MERMHLVHAPGETSPGLFLLPPAAFSLSVLVSPKQSTPLSQGSCGAPPQFNCLSLCIAEAQKPPVKMSKLMKGMNVPGGVHAGAAAVQHRRHHSHAVCALYDSKQSAGSCALVATAASVAASCGSLVQPSLVRAPLHAEHCTAV